MEFTLKRPCPMCPFRKDCTPEWLGRVRAEEIIDSITAQQAPFPCHQTVDYDDEDENGELMRRNMAGEKHCAGALILLEESGAGIGQLARIAEGFGKYDPEQLDREAATCFTNLDDFIDHHTSEREREEEGEPCGIVNGGCEAPAGFRAGGTARSNHVPAGLTEGCLGCGTEVCESCAGEMTEQGRICPDCVDL